MASAVEFALPKPRSALPASIALTFAMPAPGCTVMVTPTSFCASSAMAPPSGIQEPPWGPVMKVTCCAAAGKARVANARQARMST
jgi:hypothetical protein